MDIPPVVDHAFTRTIHTPREDIPIMTALVLLVRLAELAQQRLRTSHITDEKVDRLAARADEFAASVFETNIPSIAGPALASRWMELSIKPVLQAVRHGGLVTRFDTWSITVAVPGSRSGDLYVSVGTGTIDADAFAVRIEDATQLVVAMEKLWDELKG